MFQMQKGKACTPSFWSRYSHAFDMEKMPPHSPARSSRQPKRTSLRCSASPGDTLNWTTFTTRCWLSILPGESQLQYLLFYFYFWRLYLFISREGKGRRKRERNSAWLPLAHPLLGPGPQPRHVPWLGIELATLWFADLGLIHWATLVQAQPQHFWWLK